MFSHFHILTSDTPFAFLSVFSLPLRTLSVCLSVSLSLSLSLSHTHTHTPFFLDRLHPAQPFHPKLLACVCWVQGILHGDHHTVSTLVMVSFCPGSRFSIGLITPFVAYFLPPGTESSPGSGRTLNYHVPLPSFTLDIFTVCLSLFQLWQFWRIQNLLHLCFNRTFLILSWMFLSD